MQIASKEKVDIAILVACLLMGQPPGLQPKQIRRQRVVNPFLRQAVNAFGIGQHQIDMTQQPAVAVPEPIPIGRQSNKRHRRQPQALGDGRVMQIQHDEVRAPTSGQTLEDASPIIGIRYGESYATCGIERNAFTGGNMLLQIPLNKSISNRPIQISAGHDHSLRPSDMMRFKMKKGVDKSGTQITSSRPVV